MRILSITILQLLLPCLLWATSPYSTSEGMITSGHDLSLNKYRQTYFYTNGNIDSEKLGKLIRFLEHHKSLLMDSAKLNRKTNLIFTHGYENDRAEKEGTEAQHEEAEAIAPIIFALEHTRDLKANHSRMTAQQIHEKVETVLLFFAAGYTPYPMNMFTKVKENIKNWGENFFEFAIDDSSQTQASNLLLNGSFADQKTLLQARRRGLDISTLNPPSSPIWTDNEVEDYDPANEVYFGKRFFPPKSDLLPVFHYERMGNGTIKFKTHWFDESELTKKGKPKKKDVTLRVGREAYVTPAVNHLARIIGYPANPTTFRSQIKLELGDTTFEHFLSEWRTIHGLQMSTAMTHIERIHGENAVILKNVALEAYPDKEDYRKMGPFRMGDNGLRNRREYRAMVLYNALIALQDEYEYQSRVDAIRDPVKGWLPIFFISDTGSSLGISFLPDFLGYVGTVNMFPWEFTKVYNDKVHLWWLSLFDHRTWKDTTYSDVKWLARRMARIQTWQIDSIMAASGFPAPVSALYAEKFKSRLNKMMMDFDLYEEGFRPHRVLTHSELAARFQQYINEQGLLKEGAQEIPGNTLPILGKSFTPFQAVIALGINKLQNKFLELFNPATHGKGNFVIDIGTVDVQGGFSFAASRAVSVNPELGPGQKRYLLQDKISISLPIGLVSDRITTPLGLYYTYTFEYFHSVSTLQETGTKRFFALLNPFSIYEIRRNLRTGEQLFVTHSIGASIGKSKTKIIDDIQIDAALLGLSISAIKTIYFAKPHDTLLEVSTDHIKTAAIQSGLDVRTYLRLAAHARATRAKRTYRLYRVDTLNETEQGQMHLQEAFDTALIHNDFNSLDKLITPHELNDLSRSKHFQLGAVFWNYGSDTGVNAVEANGQPVILAHKNRAYDRSFGRVWTEKTTTGRFDSAFNFVGNFWGEGQYTSINLEGTPEKGGRNFKELEVIINISMFDNYCTRKEFENDFKEFFAERSGIDNYIRFYMPAELGVYPELHGTMRWQLSKAALKSILENVSSPSNIRELTILRSARRLLRAWDGKVSDYDLNHQAKDLVHILDRIIGIRAKHISQLRHFVRDDDIWMITSISNMLALSHPTFRDQQRNIFWAPEVGKFQGHSFMTRFRRHNLLDPILTEKKD
ncbi:hypothetical protein [Bdellovibrio reynosensis]|uniref:Uncharacterized protein n=1 Tax=Bdellovibrio reynosensis TaxID=2835041 RepID=A0ABY4C9L3_9BACT|nr:hypothetical protein [Bdellovibrio reynosensis]UOF01673.1 hypothetical protein MNR06_01735 [Bdellovibrio reynosensis]